MTNVVKLHRRKLPSDAARCLEKLAVHAKAGAIVGVAFVCIMDEDAFIADTCGLASREPEKVRQLLKTLDAKIAKRQLRNRG